MKSIFVKSLPFMTVFGMGALGLLRAADCVPDAPNGFYASFSMVTQRNFNSGNPYASYTKGTLNVSNNNSLLFYSETYSGSNNTQLFSDRQAGEGCTGIICSWQPFDIHQADLLGVSITKSHSLIIGGGSGPSYSATITLQSWGNGKITFPLTCDATTGILYGTLDSFSHVAITIGTPLSPPK
jgi:hypothetical protein